LLQADPTGENETTRVGAHAALAWPHRHCCVPLQCVDIREALADRVLKIMACDIFAQANVGPVPIELGGGVGEIKLVSRPDLGQRRAGCSRRASPAGSPSTGHCIRSLAPSSDTARKIETNPMVGRNACHAVQTLTLLPDQPVIGYLIPYHDNGVTGNGLARRVSSVRRDDDRALDARPANRFADCARREDRDARLT
jgi:hypothetical protein